MSKEKQRIHYLVGGFIPAYPSSYSYYTCVHGTEYTDTFYDRMAALLADDESLLELNEYKNALFGTVMVLNEKGRDEFEMRTQLAALQSRLNFIDQHLKNPAVVSYLVDKLIFGFIKINGAADLQEVAPVYNAKVTDPKAKANFNTLLESWAKIAPGRPSPEFRYPDVDGKEYTLKDLAGKYIYIDMWATWCGPCRAEIPSLQKLEHRYAGKEIYFVSISSDDDQKAWEELVREDQMTGIQLNINGSREFMDAYLIVGIPRFILLDKEGKIISADMTRPSDPETMVTLDSLLLN